MAVFQTTSRDLRVIAGETLSAQFDFYADDGLSISFNLAGYTLEAVLTLPGFNDAATPITLSSGSGLTVDTVNGVVQLQQDSTGWSAGTGRWYLKATDQSGAVSYPLQGWLYVGNP